MLARALVRSGYHTLSYPNVMSRIRGGHNFTAVRVSDRQVYSAPARFNALLAMDELSVNEHRDDMLEGGVVVAEPLKTMDDGRRTKDESVFRVPMAEIAERHRGTKRMANVVGLGALLALTGLLAIRRRR